MERFINATESERPSTIGYLSYSGSGLLPDDNTLLNGVKCFHLTYILLQGL